MLIYITKEMVSYNFPIIINESMISTVQPVRRANQSLQMNTKSMIFLNALQGVKELELTCTVEEFYNYVNSVKLKQSVETVIEKALK